VEELETYCALNSRLTGHVTSGVPGVELSSGSLGHGLPVGCGMALAAKRDKSPVRTVVLVSDGELDEGSNWEAILFAAHHELDNLLPIVDYNRIQSFGRVQEVLDLDPLGDKFRAFRWAVREVDGHAMRELAETLAEIPLVPGKPGVVIAGNVIGGGDWEESRIVPDTIRAWMNDRPVRLRSPQAIRPWQHVLEPLRGYPTLAEAMFEQTVATGEAWNFGPDQSDAQPVEWVVREMANIWGPGARWEYDEGVQPHEANHLTLDSSKAAGRLGWRPELRLRDALAITVAWYQANAQGREMREFTRAQITEYEVRLRPRMSHV
jgi:hypothetical protein